MEFDNIDTTILTLGEPKIDSPILKEPDTIDRHFVSDDDKVFLYVKQKPIRKMIENHQSPPTFELAGPRKKIYFDPSKLRCGLVTCGGLCPGLNDIIRAIVLELHYRYGVKNIYGINYGLQGFIPKYGHDIIDLSPAYVEPILNMGGSVLGSSRGPQDIGEVVDSVERMNIGILVMIGGDGTLMAARKISDVITERGLKISVVGIPKTIDNDIYLV